jgi:glycosyl hydrolase family 64 (putative beta-1,3-glucanase)
MELGLTGKLATLLVLTAALALCAAPAASAAINVQIVNQTGRPDSQVYVMLDGGSSGDGQLSNDVGTKLSSLKGSQFALSNLSGGRIYFSYGSPVTNAEPPGSSVRYDKVELTYPGVANLTAVDFFGIPFKLQTRAASGKALGTLAWKAPTDTVKKALLAIPGARQALVKTRSGGFARILSPQLSPSSYPSFKKYVGSLKGKLLTVRGDFFGNPFQSFAYSGLFGGAGTTTLQGTITPQGGSRAPGEALGVAGSTLPSAIYTVNGPYTWGGATHTVSDNDVYAAIYRDLIAGFAWGYWGGKYGNDSAKWRNKPPFAAARKEKTSYATYNQYAAVVYKYSNAYGFSFSDTGPKKVQLPLDNAATLRVTILPDRKKR